MHYSTCMHKGHTFKVFFDSVTAEKGIGMICEMYRSIPSAQFKSFLKQRKEIFFSAFQLLNTTLNTNAQINSN